MRIRSNGRVPSVDLDVVAELLDAAFDEWAVLEFTDDGRVCNPHDGEPSEALRLVAGQHRSDGAHFGITMRVPTMELPTDRVDEFEKRLQGLDLDDKAALDRHREERAAAMVETGHRIESATLDLLRDGDDQKILRFSRVDAGAVSVTISRSPHPTIDAKSELDLTSISKSSDDSSAILTWLLGGRADVDVHLDGGPLFARSARFGGFGSGPDNLATIRGTVSRFKIDAEATSQLVDGAWHIDLRARVGGKGIGRFATGLGGRFLKRRINQALSEFWDNADAGSRQFERGIAEIEAEIEAAGGPRPFIRSLFAPPDKAN